MDADERAYRLKKFIAIVYDGSNTSFADALGVSLPTVLNWIAGGDIKGLLDAEYRR